MRHVRARCLRTPERIRARAALGAKPLCEEKRGALFSFGIVLATHHNYIIISLAAERAAGAASCRALRWVSLFCRNNAPNEHDGRVGRGAAKRLCEVSAELGVVNYNNRASVNGAETEFLECRERANNPRVPARTPCNYFSCLFFE